MINELRKGFELMARQGDAQVIPVYLDGLYGSIFSYQGGKFFTKRPKHLRYPVAVHFGEPLPPRAATAEVVRHAMHALSAEAFHQRKSWLHADPADDLVPFANALRLAEVEWHRPGDVFLSLEPAGTILHRTVKALTQVLPGTKFIDHPTHAPASHTVAFCTRATLNQLTGQERLAFCLDTSPTNLPLPPTPTPPPLSGSGFPSQSPIPTNPPVASASSSVALANEEANAPRSGGLRPPLSPPTPSLPTDLPLPPPLTPVGSVASAKEAPPSSGSGFPSQSPLPTNPPVASDSSSVAHRAKEEALAKEAASPPTGSRPLRGYLDSETGILLTTEVPDPQMPPAHHDEQFGRRPHTLGRLLPGLTIASPPEGVTISSLLPDSPLTATIPGAKMDEQGFLVVTV